MTLMLASSPLAGAAEPAIPQAPVLPVIPKSEILPFSLEGGGDVEVAVLTAGQSVGDAAWQVRSQLPLADHAGQDIRVLARKAGVTDPAQYFDATYKVRDSYPPGSGLGTEANPIVALAGNDPRLRGWATGWDDYQPGTDVTANWQVPANAVGPVGGSGYEGNMSVVVLGNGGRITMRFDAPVFDGPGADFAVFENGFRVSGQENDFLELGYVEVSSNGTDFVRFDSGNLHDQPVGAFAGFPASKIDGVAGRDLNGLGTPFDLASLRNKPEVRDGKVDLNAIDRVRIVDIVGTVIDGVPTDLDSFGRTIYDPYKTVGSGGFDLRGIGTINRQGATIVQPKAIGRDTTSALVSASVTGSTDGAQDVRLEWSEDEDDHSDAVVKGTASTPADGSSVTPSFTVNGLEAGKSYWFRFVSESADESEISTNWIKFTKESAVISTYGATIINKVDGKAQVRFNATVQPRSDGDQEFRIEYAKSSQLGQIELAGTDTAAFDVGSKALNVIVDGLDLTTDYSYRTVSRSPDGQELVSDWKTFRTDIASKQDGLANPFTANGTARLGVKVYPGTEGDLSVYLEYARNSAYTQDREVTAAKPVSGSVDSEVVEFDITGLPTGTTYFRSVLVAGDSSEKKGSNRTVSAPGTATALTVPTVVAAGRQATITTRFTPNTYGPQSVRAEVSANADHSDPVSTEAREAISFGDQSFVAEDLDPGATYWARIVSESILHDETVSTAWVEFTAEALTDALSAPSAGSIGTDSAVVTVPVDAGSFDRSVTVEYGPNQDGSDSASTDPQVVPAGETDELTFELEGLDSNSTYWFRAVSTVAGQDEVSDWDSFETDKVPAAVGDLAVGLIGEDSAVVTARFTTGDLKQAASIEYGATASADLKATATKSADPAIAPVALDFDLSGLAPGVEYRYRLLLTAEDGDEVASEWLRFTTTKSLPIVPGAAELRLTVGSDAVLAGSSVAVRAEGLEPGESYSLTLGGTPVGAGQADQAGAVSQKVTAAKALADGVRELVIVGAAEDRTGSAKVMVLRKRAFKGKLARKKVKRGGIQKVVVKGLVRGERVRVKLAGKRVSPARAVANAKGAYTLKFRVGRKLGKKKVVVTGRFAGRKMSRTFRVVR